MSSGVYESSETGRNLLDKVLLGSGNSTIVCSVDPKPALRQLVLRLQDPMPASTADRTFF